MKAIKTPCASHYWNKKVPALQCSSLLIYSNVKQTSRQRISFFQRYNSTGIIVCEIVSSNATREKRRRRSNLRAADLTTMVALARALYLDSVLYYRTVPAMTESKRYRRTAQPRLHTYVSVRTYDLRTTYVVTRTKQARSRPRAPCILVAIQIISSRPANGTASPQSHTL